MSFSSSSFPLSPTTQHHFHLYPLSFQIMNARFIAAIAAMAPLLKLCSSFSHLSARNMNPALAFPQRTVSICTAAFQRKPTLRLDAVAALATDNITNASVKVVEQELNRALEAARAADKQHGLCTPVSQKAWTVVDELYNKVQMVQTTHCERTIKVVVKSSKTQRKPTSNGRRNRPQPMGEMVGRKYFF